MEHIVTIQEIRVSGRPIGKVDDAKLEAFLNEAEMLLVRPVIGDKLLLKLKDRESLIPELTTLIEGGSYEIGEDTRSFSGLRAAISYYVYAKNVLCGDAESTRYGMVVKDSEYSTRLSAKERQDIYHDAMEVAQLYMNDCKRYLTDKELLSCSSIKRHQQNIGITIRKIG